MSMGMGGGMMVVMDGEIRVVCILWWCWLGEGGDDDGNGDDD